MAHVRENGMNIFRLTLKLLTSKEMRVLHFGYFNGLQIGLLATPTIVWFTILKVLNVAVEMHL